MEEKARLIGETVLMRGVAAGRKTAGARKRRIEEENMMCGVDLSVADRVALDNFLVRYRDGEFSARKVKSRAVNYPRHFGLESQALPRSARFLTNFLCYSALFSS